VALVGRVSELLFGPIESVRLDAFRRVLGLSLLVWFATFWPDAREWLTPEGFHVGSESRHAFQPPPAPLLAPSLLPVLGVLAYTTILLQVFGRPRRLVLAANLALVTYLTLVDPVSASTANKLLAFALLVLLLPATRSGSVESAWRARALQATLLLLYALAGLCKAVHGDWLTNGDVLVTQVQGVARTALAARLLEVLPAPAWTALQAAALAFELAAPVAFAWRRTRTAALLFGLGFHAFVAVTMHGFAPFSAVTLAFYVLFLPSTWLRVARVREPARSPALT